MRINAQDLRLRRSRISTAPDTLLLTCLYIVSLALSPTQGLADFLWNLGLKLIFIPPLIITAAALLRLIKRFQRRAQRVLDFSDSAVGGLLKEAGLASRRVERLKAYRIFNPRRCAVHVTGLFKPQLIYTSGFELLCKYNRSAASHIVFHEAAHLLRHDTALLGMLIVAACAVASNQLFLGTYSNWHNSWVPLAAFILFVFLFRRREYTADAIAINHLESKAQYVVSLFVSDIHESDLWHPTPTARIAALYRGSPVLSTSWQVLGIGSAILLVYCLQPFAVAFAIIPVVAIIRELLKGPRRKVPTTRSEHLSESLKIGAYSRARTTTSDWRRLFEADCDAQVRRFASDGDAEEARAFATHASALLKQLGLDHSSLMFSDLLAHLDNELVEPVDQMRESSSHPNDEPNQPTAITLRSREPWRTQILRRLGLRYRSLGLVVAGACLLVAFYFGASRIANGPAPIKYLAGVPCKVVEERRTIPYGRMITVRNDGLIIERSDDQLSLSLRSDIPLVTRKDPDLIGTSISGRYSAFLHDRKEVVLGYDHERGTGKPETVVIKANDSERVLYQDKSTDPIIAIDFSPDDKFAALSTWDNSRYASNVAIVPLDVRDGRVKSCDLKEQIVEAVRVQTGGRSFTALGYSDEHFRLDPGMLDDARTASLISLASCTVIRSAHFEFTASQPFDWTPDGITVAFQKRGIQVENLESGSTRTFDDGLTQAISLSADGRYLFTANFTTFDSARDRNFIKMWSTETRALLASARLTTFVYRLAASPTGDKVWVLSPGGIWPVGCDVAIWDSSAWRLGGWFWNTLADTAVGTFCARQTGIERVDQEP